jgi:hypothetical protein
MQLVPIVALGALLFYLFKPDEDTAPPATNGNGGADAVKASIALDLRKPSATQAFVNGQEVTHHQGIRPNPRSGRCFSKIDRAGFSTDLIG